MWQRMLQGGSGGESKGEYSPALVPKKSSSDTSGVISKGTPYSNNELDWKAFDRDAKTAWQTMNQSDKYIGYKFDGKVCVTEVYVNTYSQAGYGMGNTTLKGYYQGSEIVSIPIDMTSIPHNTLTTYEVSNNKYCDEYRLYVTNASTLLWELQFGGYIK